MYQHRDMSGERLNNPRELPDYLGHIISQGETYSPPNGIVGVEEDSGLVQVELGKNKRTSMKFGKFLVKSGLGEDVARDWSSKLKSVLEQMKGAKLELTNSSEEAVAIYRDGPRSCMSGMDCVGAYHSEDVAVAFVRIGERVVARTVVCKNPDIGLQYMCIYGNEDLLLPLLKEAGYAGGDLDGCKLARIESNDNGNVLMPYLDCGTCVDDCVDHLLVNRCGEYNTQETHGYLIEMHHCDSCGDVVDNDDMQYSEYHEEHFCQSCYDERHEYVDGEHYATASDDIVETADGSWIMSDSACFVERDNEYCHVDDICYSEYLEEYIQSSDAVEAITNVEYPEGGTCHKDDCELIDGRWVHDSITEEYKQQLTLDL